nr:hypothetical protein [Tanacetum cinerariifolium]
RGDRIEEAARALRHRGTDEGLIALVVEPHGNDRAALGEHALFEVGRSLRDQPQRHAIFAAFLGDPAEDLAHRRAVARPAAWNVA